MTKYLIPAKVQEIRVRVLSSAQNLINDNRANHENRIQQSQTFMSTNNLPMALDQVRGKLDISNELWANLEQHHQKKYSKQMTEDLGFVEGVNNTFRTQY